jgi:hypothetical protein
MKEECQSLIKTNHALKKVLKKLGQNSQAKKISMNVAIKGRDNKQSVKTGITLGVASEDQVSYSQHFIFFVTYELAQ